MIQPIHFRLIEDVLLIVCSACVVGAVIAVAVRTGIEWRTLKRWGAGR